MKCLVNFNIYIYIKLFFIFFGDARILGEFYYDCDNCGYFKHMTYGPYKEGINTFSLTKADIERKKRLLEQYKECIIKLNLEINPEYIFRS